MKKTLPWACLLLAAFLGIARSGNAQVATGTLDGTVLDALGKPVDYATVTLQTSEGDRPNLTRTDGDGRFRFVRFRTGEYDVRAQSDGLFSPWTKHIRIHSHRTTQITLQLPVRKP
jgi:hypothetical protein